MTGIKPVPISQKGFSEYRYYWGANVTESEGISSGTT